MHPKLTISRLHDFTISQFNINIIMKLNKIFFAALSIAAIAFASCEHAPEIPVGPGNNPGGNDTTVVNPPVSDSDTLTVAQAIAKQDNAQHLVKGIIVGWYSNHNNDRKAIFSAEATADTTVLATNIIIAETADETDQAKCICVQLPAGPVRTALNLKDHADNLHKELLIHGTLTSYNTMAGLKEPDVAYFNGQEIKNTIGEVDGATGTGSEADPFNVAAAINKCIEIGETASTEEYYVQGTVQQITEEVSSYGNVTFTMVDPDKNDIFTVYRAKGPNGTALTEPICKAGDVVLVKGQLVNYKKNTPELTTGGQVLAVNGKTIEVAEDTTSTLPQTGVYASTIAWTNGTNAYNDGKGTVNGEANVVIYKLSTSKAAGNATLTIPEGTTKIGFYAVAWKGATNTVLKVGETDQAVRANDGATNNSPYTLTVTEEDYYEFDVTPGTLALSCDARVLIFAINAK